MGRSQVKYRTTHGRGRGRGRGGGAEAGASRSRSAAAGGGGGRRPLESNAFRYQEEQEEDDAEEHTSSTEQQPRFFRRQFFAGEENVREPSAAASGSYFQSQAVKQWEAEDDVDDPSASSSIGVLDLHWLAEQFAMVEPHIRYQMDPKYCVDFEFEAAETATEDEEETKGGNVRDTTKGKENEDAAVVSANSSKSKDPPVGSKTTMSADYEVDALLQLSSSSKPTPPAPKQEAAASTTMRAATDAVAPSQDQLEDWLDDVLDM